MKSQRTENKDQIIKRLARVNQHYKNILLDMVAHTPDYVPCEDDVEHSSDDMQLGCDIVRYNYGRIAKAAILGD